VVVVALVAACVGLLQEQGPGHARSVRGNLPNLSRQISRARRHRPRVSIGSYPPSEARRGFSSRDGATAWKALACGSTSPFGSLALRGREAPEATRTATSIRTREPSPVGRSIGPAQSSGPPTS